MHNGGEKRQTPPSGSCVDAVHFGRTGSSAAGAGAGSRTVGQHGSRSRQSGAISPPPLKRQRTSSDCYDSDIGGAGSADPRSRLHTGPSALRHSFGGQTDFSMNKSRQERSPKPPQISYSFPAPPSYPEPDCRSSNVPSRRSHVARSERSRKSVPSSKRTCRVCEKTTSATYDPMIVCPGCSRTYHDSCRKPRLIEGVEQENWRCYTCLSDPRKRKSSGIASIPTHQDSVVRDMFKSRRAHRSSTATPSALSNEVTLDRHVGPHLFQNHTSGGELHGSRTHPSKPENAQGSSGQPTPKLPDRTEIPNTPTQRSSQLEFPDRTIRTHQHVGFGLNESDFDVPFQAEDCCSSILFRSSYLPDHHDRPVFRSKRLTVGLETPETPDAVPTRDAPIPSSLELANSTAQSIIHVSAASTAPAPQRESDRLSDQPTTTDAPDDGQSDVPIELHEPIEPVVSPMATKRQERGPTFEQTKHKTNCHNEAGILRSPVDSQGGGDLEPETAKPTTLKEVEPTHISLSAVHIVSDTEQLTIPRLSPAEETAYAGTSALKQGQLTSADIKPSILPGTSQTTSHSHAPTTTTLEGTTVPDYSKRYTNRELARITLVAANGSGMTALQIIDWVAQRFSYKQKGQGAPSQWERSLTSMLSLKEEFRSDKPAQQGPGSAVLYSFANATLRARFEREWSAYCAQPVFATTQASKQLLQERRKSPVQSTSTPACATEQSPKEQPQDQRKSPVQPTSTPARVVKSGQAIKSASSRRTHISLPNPDSSLSASPDDPAINITPKHNPLFNPFERPAVQHPETALHKDIEAALYDELQSSRQTSFHKLALGPQKPSIDTMTLEEKARKIAEIKARPSRKKFFGSEHRLAHVRRYGREDIHDESDGAWIPPPTKTDEKAQKRDVVMEDSGDNRTLREVFNMPANAVPMNDGHELAFRDGTLVGRRAKKMYRVGKLFGGEITTRFS